MAGATFPLMAFARHRLGVDGRGVTSLAAAWGCPLRCRFCLNPFCFDGTAAVRHVTPQELYDLARPDDLYFRATGGGVTFGGGEPLCHSGFIAAFRDLCGGGWRVTAETSLQIPKERLREAVGAVDHFIVDIKDMNDAVYRRYTGAGNGTVRENLALLLAAAGAERVTVRVPLIPGFNTEEDVAASHAVLREMGFTDFDFFTYRTENPPRNGKS